MLIRQSIEGPANPDKVSKAGEQRPEVLLLLAAPRGFCAGVRRAIDAVRDALAVHGAPVYVRRAIVHNMDVVRSLEAEGAIFVDELDDAPEGAVVIFSAHGVSPAIAAQAARRQLIAYDAVCPLVAKVHREVERHERNGRHLILIGHPGHPEIEGTLGHMRSGRAFVVKSVDEVASLPMDDGAPAAYAVQTTYSVTDAEEIVEALRARFSDLVEPATSDICYATTNRQAAARDIALRADAIIVAGERFSSNANRLAEIAALSCKSVQLVANADEIDWARLPDGGVIGVTAAASTPETTVQDILEALSVPYRLIIEEVESVKEATVFKRLAIP
jgi:4-hydroxy-3-methylbut-2-enyl diphosphate reductase